MNRRTSPRDHETANHTGRFTADPVAGHSITLGWILVVLAMLAFILLLFFAR